MPAPMQDDKLNLIQVLEHAARFHGKVDIVTRLVETGEIHRSNYAEAMSRTRQLANALQKLGVVHGDRIGTLAWNTQRHLEAWYAIAGQGAICHTINPRLFEGQVEYIVNHAEDKILMVDVPFVPLLEQLQDKFNTVECFIIMCDEANMPKTSLKNAVAYETIIAAEPAEFAWPTFDEDTPSTLCYTSGTTGDPKGVLYTHRSNLLHAYGANGKGAIGTSSVDTVLMVVPMFHANSWGLAYSCPMAGARMVLPGAKLDGESVYELLDTEKVTMSAAVPTVWSMLLNHMRDNKLELPHFEETTVGGSAVPRSMVEAYDEYGVTIIHAWGMTEMSPIGTICRLKPFMKDWPYEKQVDIRLKQGLPLFGVEMRIADDDGNEQPHDGKSFGRLLVKGPWIVQRYYKADADCVDADGYFDTGDIATIDEHGYMQITDRAKDLIKSGGEWISSVDLENAAVGHPKIDVAAAIGIPDPKWEERPMLVLQPSSGESVTKEEVLDYLKDKVAKWWLPDRVEFVDDIPLTATGKISKLTLREKFVN